MTRVRAEFRPPRHLDANRTPRIDQAWVASLHKRRLAYGEWTTAQIPAQGQSNFRSMCNLSRRVPRLQRKESSSTGATTRDFLRREKKEKRIEEGRQDGSETVYAYYGGVPTNYVRGVSILTSKLTSVLFAIFLLRGAGSLGSFKRRRLVSLYSLEQDSLEAVSSFRLF
jgi:hypothetical protein